MSCRSCRSYVPPLREQETSETSNTQIVFDILKDLSKNKGQTIIAVTHDNEFAQSTDRIIEMKDGEIVSGNS